MTMDSESEHTFFMQPMRLAELLPALNRVNGMTPKVGARTLTDKKQQQQRSTTVMPHTVEKSGCFKPRTLAEIHADILAMQAPPKRSQPTSTMKKRWNSSVKVDQKKVSLTSGENGHKHSAVRKVLNFQNKTKPQAPSVSNNSRLTVVNATTPTFVKPTFKPKKSLHPAIGKNSLRISGVYKIPETPVLNSMKKQPSNFTLANKENLPKMSTMKALIPPPLAPLHNTNHIINRVTVPDTPLSNTSSDASFLQKEKEINSLEHKDISTETILENIAEVSPPVSTPFKDYRSVHEYFNDSSQMETSALCENDTIMCFDKPNEIVTDKREESVIVTLCDLLNKATVANQEAPSQELNELLEMEKQTENNVEMIDKVIALMTRMKETHKKSLENVRKLIKDIRNGNENKDCTLVGQEIKMSIKAETISGDYTVVRNVSVIKSCTKSPSYKIPRKNMCLKKKGFCKSMPSLENKSPENRLTEDNRAMSMYMKMKENMNFLNTPMTKRRPNIQDTPTVTSHNLQRQLDKLFNDS